MLDWVDPHSTRRLGFSTPLSRAVFSSNARQKRWGLSTHFMQRRAPVGSEPRDPNYYELIPGKNGKSAASNIAVID